MTEQPLDVRTFLRMLRRRRRLVAAFGAIGLACGLAYAFVRPPQPSAQTLVMLPPASTAIAGEATRDMRTPIVVATSASVLGPAGEVLDPPASLSTVEDRVTVEALSDDVLSIVAHAPDAADAIELANAVAEGYVAHETSEGDSPVGDGLADLQVESEQLREQVSAMLEEINVAGEDTVLLAALESSLNDLARRLETTSDRMSALRADVATDRDGTRVLERATEVRPASSSVPMAGAIGLVAGFAVGVVVATAAARRDRRLRLRDQIATTVGVPVLASLGSRRCRKVDQYVELIERYEPDPAERWSLRRLIQNLAPDTAATTDVWVMTVDGDFSAVALAAQVAAAAADLAIDTMLVAGGSTEAALPLRGACLALAAGVRRPHLDVSDGTVRRRSDGSPHSLTVTVVPVGDTGTIDVGGGRASTSQAVLAVSAGFATAEQLARVALVASDAGVPVTGILVADPDPDDPTTGLLAGEGGGVTTQLPRRLTGAGRR